MKKATRILAAIGFVMCIVTGAILALAGVVMTIVGSIMLANLNDASTPEAITSTWTVLGLGLGYLFGAPAAIPGIIFEKVVRDIGDTGPVARSKMILFGVLAAIFGWGPSGICCIVWGAIQGKDDDDESVEVKAEPVEKKEGE